MPKAESIIFPVIKSISKKTPPSFSLLVLPVLPVLPVLLVLSEAEASEAEVRLRVNLILNP